MATAEKVTRRPTPSLRTRRRARRVLLVTAVAALAALAWLWPPLKAAGVTAASYGARIACSCRFVAGRALSDCRSDFEPGMALVMLRDDVEAKSVTARVPLVASQTATFSEGQGCVLEKWEG
jgi:hypothetical protein